MGRLFPRIVFITLGHIQTLSLLMAIALFVPGTVIAQSNNSSDLETEQQQREACEEAIAEIAEAEAEGREVDPLDPECEQYVKDESDAADVVITVTGTRTERPLLDSTAAISVIERDQIERQQVREIDELIRYEPGISVGNNLQFGLQDYNIRGIGGNQVLIQVDGIRLPNGFQSGNRFNIAQGFNIGRDYFDTETLQRLEIIRGPASALYGSDALGGVVSYFTLEPGALLNAFGKDSLLEISPGYSTENEGYTNSILYATRAEDTEILVSFTRRDGFTPDNINDEVSTSRTSFLGKLVYNLTDTSSIDVTGEIFNDAVDFTTSGENLPLISSTTTFYTEEIETKRSRVSVAYTYDDDNSKTFFNYARAHLYWQDSETTEDNVRNLLGFDFSSFPPSGPFPAQRVSDNLFVDEVYGGDLQFRSDFTTGSVSHRLTYGVDISTTFNARPRDRVQTNFITRAQSRLAIPDDFPLKDFPDTHTLRLGIYVQDEIEFGGDYWAIIPGLRFDYYNLDATDDEDFGRNGAEAADFDGSSVSPSVGILYRATEQISLFGRYSRGFRAPLYDEINSGFSNQLFQYTTLSNPDLDAETSNSFELGVRGNTEQFDFSIVGFYNDYENFIEFQQIGTTLINGQNFLLFQTRNITEARTYGVEATAEYRFSPGSDGFSLLGSLGWTIGDDLTDDQPLVSVDPFEAVVGLRYQALEDRWGAELISTFVGEARGNDFVTGTGFIPDAYTVVDLVSYVNITPDITINAGVYNIFDTEYFRYQDVRFLDTEQALFEQRRDRRARPGTSFRVGFTMRF